MARHLFIAGAQRSGTSWLYRMLDQHPDIAMARPLRPEPKFFIDDAQYARGVGYYREHYFPSGDFAWLGEKSTSYIEHPLAAERIARHFPDALVLFLLRDPVERALSNHRFSVANGLETLPLGAALDAEPRRLGGHPGISVSPFAYATRGRYADYLDAWRGHFPATQLLPLVSEDLLGNESALRGLLRRLHVDDQVALHDVSLPVNGTDATTVAIDPALRARLRDRFRDANDALAQRHGVDIGRWQ